MASPCTPGAGTKHYNMLNMLTPRIVVFITAIISCLTASGQYVVGHAGMELRDEARSNRKVNLEAYYPVSTAGLSDTAAGTNDRKFPVICFAHGYLHPGDQYGNLAGILVPAGYIMLNLTSFEGLFPSHRGYADEVRCLAAAVAGLGDDPASPLYGIADTICCLMGHSMGGGASFHAATDNPDVDALVALTPYEIRPSAIEAAARVSVPTLIFSATADCITSPETNHLPMYERSAAEDKTYISIINGSHCGMGDSSRCFMAERLAGCRNGLNTEEQTAILARYMVPWLDCVMKGVKEQGALFNHILASDSAVTWLRSRPLPEPE